MTVSLNRQCTTVTPSVHNTDVLTASSDTLPDPAEVGSLTSGRTVRESRTVALPEPTGYNDGLPWWGACDIEVRPAGYEQRVICIDENGPWEATAQDVREFAYALLAAADYAEEHANDQ